MSLPKVLTFDEVVAMVPLSRKTVRRLFSDKGGPIHKLPHTGSRVLTTEEQVMAWLKNAEPVVVREPVVEIEAGPVFS